MHALIMLWRRLSHQYHHCCRTKLRFDTQFSSMVTMDSHWEEFETVTMTKTKPNVSDSITTTRSSPLTISEMVEQIPNRIHERKRGGIPAGCARRDPVLQWMRYVPITSRQERVWMRNSVCLRVVAHAFLFNLPYCFTSKNYIHQNTKSIEYGSDLDGTPKVLLL